MTRASSRRKRSTLSARSALILTAKISLAGALIWWLVASGRLDFSQLGRAHFGAALVGMVLAQCAMLACIAARWHFLTRACGLNFSWRQTLRISLIGNFAAVWTPAGLGLDGARLWQSRKLASDKIGAATASALLDRAVGVWALLGLCAITSALFAQRVLTLRGPLLLLAALCCAGFFAPLLYRLALRRIIDKRWPNAKGVLSATARPEFQVACVLALSTHLCNAVSLWCALQALNQSSRIVEFWPTILAAPAIILSSLLPLTPLGLGVTDATASTLLHGINIASGAEATMLGRVSFVAISAICGLAWLWPERGIKNQRL